MNIFKRKKEVEKEIVYLLPPQFYPPKPPKPLTFWKFLMTEEGSNFVSSVFFGVLSLVTFVFAVVALILLFHHASYN